MENSTESNNINASMLSNGYMSNSTRLPTKDVGTFGLAPTTASILFILLILWFLLSILCCVLFVKRLRSKEKEIERLKRTTNCLPRSQGGSIKKLEADQRDGNHEQQSTLECDITVQGVPQQDDQDQLHKNQATSQQSSSSHSDRQKARNTFTSSPQQISQAIPGQVQSPMHTPPPRRNSLVESSSDEGVTNFNQQ